MPYQLVPNAGESLLDTRDAIRENFNIITTAQSVNHVSFDLAGQGKHKFLQIPEINTQSPSTIPATGVNEGALYTKVADGVTNLFFRAESNGAEIQLTRAQSTGSALIGSAASFKAHLVEGANPFPYVLLPADIGYSYNIATITKTAIGDYTIVFTNVLPSSHYVITIAFVDNTGNSDTDNHTSKVITASRTASGFRVQSVKSGNRTTSDPITMMISCIGG